MENQMKNLKIDLSQQALKYKQERVTELLNNHHVIDFLNNHKLDDSFVFEHFSKFDRWVKVIERDPEVSEYDSPGYELELEYVDGLLDFKYVQTLGAKDQEEKLNHLQKYRVNHLPQPMFENSLQTLDVQKEDNAYVKIASTLMDLLEKPIGKGIYLHGSIGCGKTHLMACLANDYARFVGSVSFVRMSELLVELKSLFDDQESYNRLMNGLLTSKLLVLDDLGAENVTPWGRDEILFNLLNHRMENELLTCFTSNLDLDDLKQIYLNQQYGVVDENKVERLMERIKTLATPIFMYGPSRRTL